MQVHAYYRFRPVTALLSVNYFDRFLSSHSLPVILLFSFTFPRKCLTIRENYNELNKVSFFLFSFTFFIIASEWVAVSATVSCVLVFSGENGRTQSTFVIGSPSIRTKIRIWTQNHSKNGAPSDVHSQLETQFLHPIWLSALLLLQSTLFQLQTRFIFPGFLFFLGSHSWNHPRYFPLARTDRC